jgi:hypothetical protein
MNTRLAKLSDAQALAELHIRCARQFDGGLALQLGTRYIRTYYRILISEKKSVVLCTEDGARGLVGLASGTLDYYSEHESALARNRIPLLWAAVPALLRSPSLVRAITARTRARKFEESHAAPDDLAKAHFMFWGWDPDAELGGGAIVLMQKWLSVVRLLGAKEIIFEVDSTNKKVVQIHRLLGARTLRTVNTPDRGQRFVMEYAEKKS